MGTEKNINKIIESSLKINKQLKEKFGEVNTPEKIITDMINTLPDEVWGNPNLKWFDPCAGSGNFFLVILERLMNGLKFKIPNKKDRETHILSNMLYMNEINKDSIIKIKENFGKKINITNYDFLNYNFNKNKLEYDIIIGNPPYNLGGTKTSGKKNIYVFFAVISLQILKQNGYLLFIHPPGYRIDNHFIKATNINLNKIYTSYDIHFIKMFNIRESNKYFNIAINVDYILIKKSKNNNKTIILDTYNKKNIIKINPNDFIPNFGFKLLNKLKYLTNKYGNIKIYHSSELHSCNVLSDGTKLKHNLGKFKNIHLIIQKGKRIYTSKKKHTYYNNKKIFINALGVNYIYYDSKGEYGASEQQLLIIEPSNIYIDFFTSSLFQFISEATKITGNNISRNDLYKFLPDFNKMKNLNNIKDIKKIINITNEEEEFIEKFKINVFKDKDIYSIL
jgi:hypothetical protein